jgi:hypothetical protein
VDSASRAAIEADLRTLASRYAVGADTGDIDLFTSAFLPAAGLVVHTATGAAPSKRTGHDELAQIPPLLADRYDQTFHFLGQSLYEVGDAGATGLVYCLAHHVKATADGGVDLVMHMSYDDTYVRDDAGAWKIAERTARIRWTETRATDPFGDQ